VGSIVYSIIANLCEHDNSWTVALSYEILHEDVAWQPLEPFLWVFGLHDTRGQDLALSEGFTCFPEYLMQSGDDSVCLISYARKI